MTDDDEEWVKAAMSDDAVVVEVLVRLHHAPHPHPLDRATLPLEWSVRQKRSKSISANKNLKKPAHRRRGCSRTPLSWSGDTSFSGESGGAGSEDSSRPTPHKLSSMSRSKVSVNGEKTNSNRPRKKKTLAELKNEESLLLKERRDLEREMATLRLYLETQNARYRNLKRMKVDLQPRLDKQSKSSYAAEDSNSGQLQPEVTARFISTAVVPAVTAKSSTPNACTEAKTDTNFVLPDLNVPFDEQGCYVPGIRR